MSDTLASTFTDVAVRKLEQCLGRISTCLGQLDDDAIWARGSQNENAPGNLVLHLAGNLRQWILSGVGGQPDTRRRDEEFAARDGFTRQALLDRLGTVVAEAVQIIRAQTPAQLLERHAIQKYDVTVLEAIFHVVEHFSHHTGQIIFATKLVTHADMGFYKHLNRTTHEEATP